MKFLKSFNSFQPRENYVHIFTRSLQRPAGGERTQHLSGLSEKQATRQNSLQLCIHLPQDSVPSTLGLAGTWSVVQDDFELPTLPLPPQC